MSLLGALDVPGKPEAKGSMRRSRTGALYSANPRLPGWQRRVALAARALLDGAGPVSTALYIQASFRFQRPASHYTRRTGRLREGAPSYPRRGDLDKLARALLDALTGVVYLDDSQVTDLDVNKTYAREAGLSLRVYELTGAGNDEVES